MTAPAGRDCPESIVFDFEVVDAAGTASSFTWSNEFGYSVTETVFEDTFETDKGWQATGVSNLGKWQRGDPVGTMNGSDQANPETDSPGDAGTQCYVTENGLPGGPAGLTDVDPTAAALQPNLYSPWLDLSVYKRARAIYDLWYYDDSTLDPIQDYGEIGARTKHPNDIHRKRFQDDPTGGWITVNMDLTPLVPMATEVRLAFIPFDNSPDHVVEMGVDNVFVEGDRQVCDDLGIVNPPNGIDDTLRVNKQDGNADIVWQASPVDGSHDGAAYYELYVSGTPDVGFAVTDSSAATSAARSLGPITEYYLLSAVNAAGGSGDEPTP